MELPACPVETTLMLIGDKWKVLILRELMEGTKRFEKSVFMTFHAIIMRFGVFHCNTLFVLICSCFVPFKFVRKLQ